MRLLRIAEDAYVPGIASEAIMRAAYEPPRNYEPYPRHWGWGLNQQRALRLHGSFSVAKRQEQQDKKREAEEATKEGDQKQVERAVKKVALNAVKASTALWKEPWRY